MIKTNMDKLPVVATQGQVWHSKARSGGRITVDGNAIWLQGTGGIVYNAKVGDRCVGWVADHLEPCVTIRHSDDDHNGALQTFACIGNVATVVSGDAKGGKGFVTGKHGGCEHLIVHFPEDVLEKLNIDDKIGVRATGQGMELSDYPGIKLLSMSPALLGKMNITEKDGKLTVGVAKIVPAAIMGSGLGASSCATGDYDIQLFDDVMVKEYNLGDLRFGDIVAITDADSRFGRSYRTGAVTIGVIIHGDSFISGHGPGVTTLMTSKTALIEPVLDQNANLANYFL